MFVQSNGSSSTWSSRGRDHEAVAMLYPAKEIIDTCRLRVESLAVTHLVEFQDRELHEDFKKAPPQMPPPRIGCRTALDESPERVVLLKELVDHLHHVTHVVLLAD